MIVVLPFCPTDARRLAESLEWMSMLGGVPNRHALLVADAAVDWRFASDLLTKARTVFKEAFIISTDQPVQGWPQGPNSLWKTAAQRLQKQADPWLWLEPDAIPLKPGWAEAIAVAYHNAGRPFFGAFVHDPQHLPKWSLNGNAVYPANAWQLCSQLYQENIPWDTCCAQVMMPLAASTNLIQHFWGQKGLPPTFVLERRPDSPINALTLSSIQSQSVIFHRNQDSTLIQCLSQQSGVSLQPSDPQFSNEPLSVVMPFCAKDAQLALLNLQWQVRMADKKDRRIVLHHDSSVPEPLCENLKTVAAMAYANVVDYRHVHPPRPGWPTGPNFSFQQACQFMARHKSPWMWLEPDAVPLRPDWLESIESEYHKARKPFLGTIIGGMGHMNGVGVYPPAVANYAPAAMTCVDRPWDVAAMHQIAPRTHRANHLICHCRAMVDGCCKDTHGGLPVFKTQTDLNNMTTPEMCVFHPSKDGTLLKRLHERLSL